MVSPRSALNVDSAEGLRWELALQLLEGGEASVGIGNLLLRTDPATQKAGRRLHIEFPCLPDPAVTTEHRREQLHGLGNHDLDQARERIQALCDKDDRFATLVADSGVVYEFVHDYGMGTLLVATARRTGPLNWK